MNAEQPAGEEYRHGFSQSHILVVAPLCRQRAGRYTSERITSCARHARAIARSCLGGGHFELRVLFLFFASSRIVWRSITAAFKAVSATRRVKSFASGSASIASSAVAAASISRSLGHRFMTKSFNAILS